MGLSLEEINSKFGDRVEMDLQDALGINTGSSSEPSSV